LKGETGLNTGKPAAKNGRIRLEKSSFLSILLLLLMSACQPGLTPVARPTAAVLTVQSTPALQSLGKVYQVCVQELANTGLVLLDTPAVSLDPDRAGLALRWGAGSSIKNNYAVVIGQEELVFIVHPQNPLKGISLADLQAIYSGKQRDWPQSSPAGEIQPWVYLPGDDAQAVFETSVLKGQAVSTRVTFLAPDPEAMRDAIASSPAAIGFLPRRWLNQTVKQLPVEGLDTASLRQPILALSKSAPDGIEKSWLICLQDQLAN
jgi:hypothetical protein